MKRKIYKVELTIKYQSSMLHSGRSAKIVKEEVEDVFRNLLKQDNLVEKAIGCPPQIKCYVRLDNGRR